MRTSNLAATWMTAAVLMLASADCGSVEPIGSADERRYTQAMQLGSYDEAEAVAKALLDKAIRAGERDSLRTAELLNQLAIAQRLNKNFETAVQNYELSVSIIESLADNLSIDLETPLRGIGAAYLDDGRPDLALPYIERALHVRQVNEGPHSIAQLDTLRQLIDVHTGLGNRDVAAGLIDRLYWLNSRQLSEDSVQMVPVLNEQGRMFAALGDREGERSAYARAIALIEKTGTANGDVLVESRIGLANSYVYDYFEDYFSATSDQELPDKKLLTKAESLLQEAVSTARENRSLDWRLHATALLAMADYRTMTGDHSQARRLYKDTWLLLSEDESRLQRRRLDLEGVTLLLRLQPNLETGIDDRSGAERPSSELVSGHIVVAFNINRRGRTTDIGLVEIVPERDEKLESEVKWVLSRAVYRPRFENGFAAESPGQTLRYEFLYPASTADNR